MNDKPIIPISVIIPCYRSGQTIRRAIDSVRSQTYLPAQTILVDDASGDDSLTLLYELQRDYPELNIHVDALAVNSGPGTARNRAWELATQAWLAFLDADDAWHPHKLEIQWDWISAHPQAVLVGALTAEILSLDRIVKCAVPQTVKANKISFTQMLIANRFHTRTVVLKKDLPFRFADRSYTEDYLLWLEIILAGLDAYVINQTLGLSFRPEFSSTGYSAQLWRHEKRELRAWYFLYQTKKISLWILMFAIPWSYFKYLRRVIQRAA